MTSLPVTLPAPELPPGTRAALIVATGTYADSRLTPLIAAARDAAAMSGVLADPNIGSFQVTSVVDRSAHEIRLALEDFLEARQRGDIALVYLSCHGLLDKQDRLYFAAVDTRIDRLAATGVSASWLWPLLEECRASRQIIILDCCNSGSFGRAGGKGEQGEDLRLPERFKSQGRGRAVLTASRANQRSWEGNQSGVDATLSVFTGALVEGLRTGAADSDGDGFISVDEAYVYSYERVLASSTGQVPQRWMSGAEGTLLIARNPGGRTVIPAPLPDDLSSALSNRYPEIRVGAVNALEEWFTSPDPAQALAAENILRRIVANDVPEVAAAARAFLDSDTQTASIKRSWTSGSSSEYSPVIERGSIVDVLVTRGQPPEILSAPFLIQVENVICVDSSDIPDYPGDTGFKRDYYRRVVLHYQIKHRLQPVGLAIRASDQRALDLYISIKAIIAGNDFDFRFARGVPARPRVSRTLLVKTTNTAIQASGDISAASVGNVTINTPAMPHQEMSLSDDGLRLEAELEIPKLLPGRIEYFDRTIYLTTSKTSIVAFDAKIYAGAARPYPQRIELELKVTDKEMTYSEILEVSNIHME